MNVPEARAAIAEAQEIVEDAASRPLLQDIEVDWLQLRAALTRASDALSLPLDAVESVTEPEPADPSVRWHYDLDR